MIQAALLGFSRTIPIIYLYRHISRFGALVQYHPIVLRAVRIVLCLQTLYRDRILLPKYRLSWIWILIGVLGGVIYYRRQVLDLFGLFLIGRVVCVVARYVLPGVEVHRDVLSGALERSVHIGQIVELRHARRLGLRIGEEASEALYKDRYDYRHCGHLPF